MVNRTSNIDSRLSEFFAYYPNAWILELAKGARIIEVRLYLLSSCDIAGSSDNMVRGDDLILYQQQLHLVKDSIQM